MAAVWDKVCKEATCLMCFRLYEEPKILPCLHTFCKRCLTSEELMVKGSDQESKCCLCPEVFTLTSIEEFPTNTATLQLVELVTKYQETSKQAPPLCQSCLYESQAGMAVASCLHCDIFLCTSCVTVHKKLRVTSAHRVVSIDDIKSGKVDLNSVLNQKQDLCATHHDKPMDLFCKKEECFLCLGCAIVQHRDHQYDFISQIVEEQKQDIKLVLPHIKAKINQLGRAIADVEKRQMLIQKRNEENVLTIEETFEGIITVIMQRKEEILHKINGAVHRRIQSLNKQLNEMEILLHKMKQYLEFTEETTKSKRNHMVMCMKNLITDRGRSLVEQCNQTKFAPSELLPRKVEFQTLEGITMMIKQLGTIPLIKNCVVEMDKTSHENLSQFTLTVKNAFEDPVLGYATFVNAVFSTSKDGPSTPLQVYDAGNGKYMFFNSCKSYCNICNNPLECPSLTSNPTYQHLVSVYHPFCYHCDQHCVLVWSQWVSVLINEKHVTGSPFK